MVDRRREGTDTLSTLALLRTGVLQLHRWGLLDRVIAAGTPPVKQTTFHYGEVTETVAVKPKAGVPALFAPRRTVLDTILVEAASDAGVDTRFGVSVAELMRDETGRVTGIAGRDRSGGPFTVTAPITIGADGKHSVVAREVNAPIERQGRSASAVIYSYWSGIPVDGYETFYRPGMSAGLVPTNDGLTCVWVGIPPTRLTRGMLRDVEGTFHRLLAEAAPEAVSRLADARRHGQFFPFPGATGFQRQPWGPGWALVGDASHFKDPLSTHGMSDALRDADFLAQAVGASLGGEVDEATAFDIYHQTRNRLSETLFTVTDEVASYHWDLKQVPQLLRALARSMKDEVDALMSLDRQPATLAA
jgi:2-polyprenyl-6-methoxyphenol hydroxylase-like FAD-dependent oxidoreductase